MNESTPKKQIEGVKSLEKVTTGEERTHALLLLSEATKLFIEKKDRTLYNKIVEFVTEFRKKHGGSTNFLLLHDLIGSSVAPEEESTTPLDTEDGEIENFIREQLSIHSYLNKK